MVAINYAETEASGVLRAEQERAWAVRTTDSGYLDGVLGCEYKGTRGLLEDKEAEEEMAFCLVLLFGFFACLLGAQKTQRANAT